MSALQDNAGKGGVRFRGAPAIILNAFSAWVILVITRAMLSGKHGLDVYIYCQAASVVSHGQNPYISKELGILFPWIYQPIYLALAGLFCALPLNFQGNYPLFYLLLIVFSTMLWSSKKEWGLAILLSLSIFLGFSWILFSGNFTAIEFFLISCGFALLKKQKWSASAVLFGLTASMKLITLLYLGLFILVPPAATSRRRSLLFGLAGFAAPLLLSSLFYPGLMPFFFLQAIGAIPNAITPITEIGGVYNPSLPNFISRLFQLDPLKFNLLFTIVLGIAGVCFLVYFYNKTKTLPIGRAFYQYFAFAFIVLTFLLPRDKPYNFALLAPAIWWLIREEKAALRYMVQLTAVFLPACAFFLTAFTPMDAWYKPLLDYGQTVSLLATIAIIYIYQHAGKAKETSALSPNPVIAADD